MTSVSDSPPGSADENPRNPASLEDRREKKLDLANEASPASVFVNSEPIREEQVQNAVKFLAHPKVKGSPVMYRRSFLERKGLTKEEIDEAFRRVPDPSPGATTTAPSVNNQDGETRTYSNTQPQLATQVFKPASKGSTKMGMMSQLKWYHGIIALGFLATSGIGTAVIFKNSIIPWLKSWIRKVVFEEQGELLLKKNNAMPTLVEETAVAAKAAAAAAADVARTSQEILVSQNEEKRCYDEIVKMLNVQVAEMKSMSDSLKKLESGQTVNQRNSGESQDKEWASISKPIIPPYTNGTLNSDIHSESPSPPSTTAESSGARHPSSYIEIVEMIKRGEKPPNIREIDDSPPNPNQPLSNPRLAPRPKPWEVNQAFSNTYQASGTPSYEVTDSALNADGAVPYWQQKGAQITKIEPDIEHPVSVNPPRRSWVPPQPPPVMMAEAAAAIRHPKKAIHQAQTEQLTDEQLLARSTSAGDELQRITKIAETGGTDETDSEKSRSNSIEL